jgi:hypothetical protein
MTLAAALLAGCLLSADADARAHRPPPPKLVLLAKPAAASEGARLSISGRAKRLPAPRRAFRVDLQVKSPGKAGQRARFTVHAKARVDRRGRFSLDYRVPQQGAALLLRVRLLRGRKVVVTGKPWKLSIRPADTVDPDRESKTLVLLPESVIEAPEPGKIGQMRLSGSPDLHPGDIIAVGVGPVTPYGFLGRAVSVSQDVGGTVVQTTPATLQEALPEGSFSGEMDPPPIDLESFSTATGAAAGMQDAPRAQPGVRIRKAFKCGGGGELTVSGTIDLDSRIEASGSWGLLSGLKARFVGHMSATGELELTASAGVSCEIGMRTLFIVPLGTVTFFAGPVPVVLVPAVSATLGGGGSISGSVSASAGGVVAAQAGVDYHDGQAHPVGGVQPVFTGGNPPTPAGSGHLEATLSPAISVLVYGVAGPKATLHAGISLDAMFGEDPSWRMTAPVSATAALSITALNLNSPELTIWQETYLLGEG